MAAGFRGSGVLGRIFKKGTAAAKKGTDALYPLQSVATGEEPRSSTVGLVLSLVSLAVMPTLAYWKGRTGREMGSRALQADAIETWVCA